MKKVERAPKGGGQKSPTKGVYARNLIVLEGPKKWDLWDNMVIYVTYSEEHWYSAGGTEFWLKHYHHNL